MRSKPDSEVEKRKRDTHLGRCDICRAETSEKADHSLKDAERLAKFNAVVARCVVSAGAVNEPVVVIDSLPSSKLTKVTVSIVRMTCGTCVGKISEALEAKPWSRSVNVSLLTNSAVVTVVGGEHLADIVQTIQDGGYEATLERVDEANPLRETWSERLSDTLRASYAVGGMTCSTCIGNITEALQKHGWVKRVDINLISNSATVLFEGRDNLQAIADTIEDVGYNATLNDMIELERAQHQVKGRRVIAIRVTGMFCDHCPSRIHNSLEEFGQRLTIEKPLSIADPIVKVSYLPDAPEFTIRHILASISTVDPTLETSIYQSPTLEERSRMIHVREQRRLWLRTAFSVTVAIPTFIIAIAFGSLAPSQNRVRQFLMHPVWSGQVKRVDWALLFMATATPVYLFAADIFHRRALKEIQAMWRRRSPTPVLQRFYRFGSMNMLMSLSTSIAYISSVVGLVMAAMRSSYMASENSGSAYFDSVVFLTMFILLGKSIEAYSRSKTGDAVTMLGKLRPSEAILVDPYSGGSRLHNFYHEQRTRYVAVDVLEFGDIVKVFHGGSPPCDGVILEGESKFDESSLTGESKLVRKSVSDEIFSGSINKDPAVSIRISGISGETMLDQIMQVVREGQTRRAPVERLVDLLTSYFVPAVTLCAISIWIIWLSLGLSVALPRDYLGVGIGGWLLWSLQFAIAVFVIACPCGIALAAPTALFVGGGLAARNGILVKGGGEAFQEARGLDRIVFDKTGTLTRGGEPVITDYEFVSHEDDSLVRAVVQWLEESSSHPIAKALVSFCDSNEMREVEARDTEEIAGEGMRGAFTTKSMRKEHVLVLVGNESLMADYNVHIPVHIVQTINTWKAQGKPIALVAINTSPRDISLCEPGQNVSPAWKMVMICAVSDPPRPEAFAIVDALERRGMDVWMMSGDNPTTATAVGDTVGMPRGKYHCRSATWTES